MLQYSHAEEGGAEEARGLVKIEGSCRGFGFLAEKIGSEGEEGELVLSLVILCFVEGARGKSDVSRKVADSVSGDFGGERTVEDFVG